MCVRERGSEAKLRRGEGGAVGGTAVGFFKILRNKTAASNSTEVSGAAVLRAVGGKEENLLSLFVRSFGFFFRPPKPAALMGLLMDREAAPTCGRS